MKIVREVLLCAALLAASHSGYARTIDPPYEVGTWPGFRLAAISFTYDDNCTNQLKIAVPMFNEFGFKVTLFTLMNASGMSLPDWPGLQAAAAQGHEIASHTVTHPYLNQLTLAQQTAELKNSKDTIDAHIPDAKCLTLAYPYCVPSDMKLTHANYIAARHCQGRVEPSTPPDLYQISSIICGSTGSVTTTDAFTTLFRSAAGSKGWCVLLIHGIDNDGGYSPVQSTVLRGSLEFLNAQAGTYWVATFLDAVRYIRERDSVSVKEVSNGGDSITLQVTDPCDNTIYNYPLTLRRPLPSDWSGASVSQNGRTAGARIVTVSSVKYMMFDVVPDAGDVVLSKGPVAPTGLTTVPGNATVALDWDDSSESSLEGYHVYRSTVSGRDYSKLTDSPVTTSSYTDVNIPHDATYYYVVSAVGPNSHESDYSNEVRAGLYGDWSGNGVVRLNDLLSLCTSWLVNDCDLAAGLDLNEDCTVNLYEFSVLGGNWGQGPQSTVKPPVNRPR